MSFAGLFPVTSGIVVVGHPGWPSLYPANTLGGLMAAATVAGMLEVDVRRSGDGKLMLSHDPILGGHVVAETPWRVLGEIDLGSGHHPALLDEALAALPGVSVQLEVKNWPGEPGFEPDHRLALETAERARPGDMVTGFNWDTQLRVHRVYPDLATGIALAAPLSLEEGIRHCQDVGHGVLIPEHSLLAGTLNTDLAVYPWTVNDPGRARELVELGVTGIITDDPGLMTATLGSDP